MQPISQSEACDEPDSLTEILAYHTEDFNGCTALDLAFAYAKMLGEPVRVTEATTDRVWTVSDATDPNGYSPE
jgi:hypothetical protein